MFKHSLLFCSACLLSSGALASGHFGLYFVAEATADQSFSGASSELDGDGFGLHGAYNFSAQSSGYVEYSAVEYDENESGGQKTSVDIDLVQVRLGYARMIPLGEKLALSPKVEAISLTLDGDTADTGFGLHVALNYAPSDCWNIYGQVGYLNVDDLDGAELKIGAMFQASEKYSLFVDYRASRLEDDSSQGGNGDFDLDDIRLGVAVHF